MDDIPQTQQGLVNYIEYARRQVKENELHNKRLLKKISQCFICLETYKEKGKFNE